MVNAFRVFPFLPWLIPLVDSVRQSVTCMTLFNRRNGRVLTLEAAARLEIVAVLNAAEGSVTK
jgi:hypothetical protein